MRAVLYHHGNNTDEVAHFVVSLVILKSEFDALLMWPFCQSVHFILVNQEDPTPHNSDVSATLKMEPSTGCHRPCTEMIDAPLDSIPFWQMTNTSSDDVYTKEDTIYVYVRVDTDGLQKF